MALLCNIFHKGVSLSGYGIKTCSVYHQSLWICTHGQGTKDRKAWIQTILLCIWQSHILPNWIQVWRVSPHHLCFPSLCMFVQVHTWCMCYSHCVTEHWPTSTVWHASTAASVLNRGTMRSSNKNPSVTGKSQCEVLKGLFSFCNTMQKEASVLFSQGGRR